MFASRGFSRFGMAWACLVFFLGHSSLAEAAPPRVTFDVASLVECRDVTPIEFARAYPREKLIVAHLQISTLIAGEDASGLTELFYRVDSPERSFSIADYLPKTTLSTDYAGNVGIEEKDEQASTLGLNAAGAYGPLSSTNATLSTGDKTANCRKYELLPPLETVAASGTVDRANGVYFKLRPNPRNSIEGAQEFVTILRVPSVWRADYMTVRCQAFGRPRRTAFPSQDAQVVGQGNFLVTLFLSGDEKAQDTAGTFVRAESELRRIAAGQRSEIERRSAPTPVHELAVQFAGKSPRIPANWLEQTLVGQDREAIAFMGYLPPPVRDAAMDYFAARRQLRGLHSAGSRLPKPDSTAAQ